MILHTKNKYIFGVLTVGLLLVVSFQNFKFYQRDIETSAAGALTSEFKLQYMGCLRSITLKNSFIGIDGTVQRRCRDGYAVPDYYQCGDDHRIRPATNSKDCQKLVDIRRSGFDICKNANLCGDGLPNIFYMTPGQFDASKSTITNTDAKLFFRKPPLEGCVNPEVTTAGTLTISTDSDRAKMSKLQSLTGNSLKLKLNCDVYPLIIDYTLSASPDSSSNISTVAKEINFSSFCKMESVNVEEKQPNCTKGPKKGLGFGISKFALKKLRPTEEEIDLAVSVLRQLRVEWFYNWSLDGFAPVEYENMPEFVPMINRPSIFESKTYHDENKVSYESTEANEILSDFVNLNPKVTTVLGYNEPERDLNFTDPDPNSPGGQNVIGDTPSARAISMWPQILNFSDQLSSRLSLAMGNNTNWPIKVGSPALAGDGAISSWLDNFRTNWITYQNQQVKIKDTINFIAVHWHNDSTDPAAFKEEMLGYYYKYKKPIWITELSPADWGKGEANHKKPGINCQNQVICAKEGMTDAERTACEAEYDVTRANHHTVPKIKEFMRDIIPWMQSQKWIQRYAWYSQFDGDKPQNCTARLYNYNADNKTVELTDLGQEYSKY